MPADLTESGRLEGDFSSLTIENKQKKRREKFPPLFLRMIPT
jgi:hypothetical protein